MPDLDTDPALMRQQQDRDTPQRIADGGSGTGERSHSDDRSRADREAAKAGATGRSGEATPMTLHGNGQSPASGRYGIASVRNAALARSAGLVRRGRSLLGN